MDFNILRAARAIVRVTDFNAARDFYVNALGFIETEADEDHIYLRGLEEHVHHSYVLKKASEPGVEAISFKVHSESDIVNGRFAVQPCSPNMVIFSCCVF